MPNKFVNSRPPKKVAGLETVQIGDLLSLSPGEYRSFGAFGGGRICMLGVLDEELKQEMPLPDDVGQDFIQLTVGLYMKKRPQETGVFSVAMNTSLALPGEGQVINNWHVDEAVGPGAILRISFMARPDGLKTRAAYGNIETGSFGVIVDENGLPSGHDSIDELDLGVIHAATGSFVHASGINDSDKPVPGTFLRTNVNLVFNPERLASDVPFAMNAEAWEILSQKAA